MKNRPNPLVAEVRTARMELSAKFGHDLRKVCDYLRKEERKHPDRLVIPNRISRRQNRVSTVT